MSDPTEAKRAEIQNAWNAWVRAHSMSCATPRMTVQEFALAHLLAEQIVKVEQTNSDLEDRVRELERRLDLLQPKTIGDVW